MAETARPDRAGTSTESPGWKERAQRRWNAARDRVPLLDHLVRTVQHYGAVKGNLQAGAVTYFAFLSFFPILALGFFVIGYVSELYPQAESALTDAINEILPGMVGDGEGQISLDSVREAAGAAGVIGLVGVLYSGLGWLSGMRGALLTVFVRPQHEQPNFFLGKARDLVSLAVIGVTLVVSVAVSGAVTGFSQQILALVNLGAELSWLLALLGLVVGLMANMVLFFTLFRLLGKPDVPGKSLWQGALLGAVGFEVLKQLSTFLMASTKQQPAFQAFGIALILVVWINYFSRVVVLSAAWAHTAPAAREARERAETAPAEQRPADPSVDVEALAAARRPGVLRRWGVPFAAGSATTVAALTVWRSRAPGPPADRGGPPG